MDDARPRGLHDRPAALALLIVLALAVLYLPWLGHSDLVHEETRRAVVARNMVETGDYLVPELAERIYLAKPPVFNWMILATSAPAGEITEFTARLPSVLALGALALFMAFVVGRRLDAPGRWLLGLSVLFTGELMHKAVLAEIDVAFTLLVTVGLWGWFELDERGHRGLRLWGPPALVVAVAFLTKREPALVFHYLGIGGYLLYRRRFLELFRPAHLAAAALTLGIIGAWLALVASRAGADRLWANLDEEVLSRGITNSATDYLVHFIAYPLEVLAAALPFSVLLLPLAWPGVSRVVRAHGGRMFTFAVIVAAINFPLYWLRADANVRYFLPMFPALLVIAATVFDAYVARACEWPARARRLFAGIGGAMLVLAAVLATAGLVLALPGLFPEVAGPIMPAPVMAGACMFALAAIASLVLRHRRRVAVLVFAGTLGFGILFRLLTLGYVVPHQARDIERTENAEAVLETVRGHLPPDVEHVQAIGWIPHAIWFYDRRDTVVPEARFERTGEMASDYVLLRTFYEDRLDSLDGHVERIARIPYSDGDFILARVDRPPADPR